MTTDIKDNTVAMQSDAEGAKDSRTESSSSSRDDQKFSEKEVLDHMKEAIAKSFDLAAHVVKVTIKDFGLAVHVVKTMIKGFVHVVHVVKAVDCVGAAKKS